MAEWMPTATATAADAMPPPRSVTVGRAEAAKGDVVVVSVTEAETAAASIVKPARRRN